jgi:hypothetical protein
MIYNSIFELGDMLGLVHEDIKDIISKKKSIGTNVNSIPIKEIYKGGGFYATISIKDF